MPQMNNQLQTFFSLHHYLEFYGSQLLERSLSGYLQGQQPVVENAAALPAMEDSLKNRYAAEAKALRAFLLF